MRFRTLPALMVLFAAAVPRATPAQTPIKFSAAAALALPVGDLGDAANVGFNLAARGEGRLSARDWSIRGDLSWDRFGGHGIVDSYSFLAIAGNLVHRSANSRMYEFGGIGLYGTKTAFRSELSRDEANLGLQGGLGFDSASSGLRTFLEFGLTTVFMPQENSVWFPVRVGVRF